MTKTIVKRLTAFVLALVMCATAFMAAGGANVKAAGPDDALDGLVWPTGTVEKDVFHFSTGCRIHYIAGNENLVPSRQELIDNFSADALYSYFYDYMSDVNTTFVYKGAQNISILNNRLVPFTTASGTVYFKPEVFRIKLVPQRDMGQDRYFAMIAGNEHLNTNDYYFDIARNDSFQGLATMDTGSFCPLESVDYKVIVSFYSPACYFEVTDTWTFPLSHWSKEAAEAGQSIEEYFK